jgi:hypothetical protein
MLQNVWHVKDLSLLKIVSVVQAKKVHPNRQKWRHYTTWNII